MLLTTISVILLLLAPAYAQQEHPFWDRTNTVAFASTFAVRSADAAQTCYHLRQPGWHEESIPSQSCAVITGWIMGGQVAQLGGTYLLHRLGHHRLERWLPYVAVSGNVTAIEYSFTH